MSETRPYRVLWIGGDHFGVRAADGGYISSPELAEQLAQSAALLAERDELREALRACVTSLESVGDELGLDEKQLAPLDAARAILSRHPAQPIKGTPGG